MSSTRLDIPAIALRGIGALRPVGRTRRTLAHLPPLPETRAVTIPGRGAINVRYAEGPAGSVPVLLLHGVTWTADINYFGAFEELSRRHTVIGLDHRGHGSGLPLDGAYDMEDLADDAQAVLDALGIESAIVVGFSLGALTALHFGLRHPEATAGLVLSAGTLCVTGETYEQRIAAVALPVAAALARLGVGRTWSARYFGMSRRRSEPDLLELWPWLRAELARTSPLAVVLGVRAAVRHDVRGMVEPLRDIPTVVMTYERDGLIPPRQQRAMAEELGADVVLVDADHDAPVLRPAANRDAMLDAVDIIAAQVEGRGRVAG